LNLSVDQHESLLWKGRDDLHTFRAAVDLLGTARGCLTRAFLLDLASGIKVLLVEALLLLIALRDIITRGE